MNGTGNHCAMSGGVPRADGRGADLEEPLLRRLATADEPTREPRASNFWACVFMTLKAIFGAGMMALPRACSLLGAWVGLGMLGLVGVLTWYSITEGLIRPAARLVSSHADGTQPPMPSRRTSGAPGQGSVWCYSTLVRTHLGHAPVQLLNAFLLANAIGFSVMYVDVIADVLLGSEGSRGIITDALAWAQSPEWLSDWILFRPVFLGLFTLLVLTPISLQPNISALRHLSAVGLAALATLGLLLAWLAGSALAQGKAHTLPLAPDLAALGGAGFQRVLAVLSLLPVVLAALGCHMNILPMASSMTPFSEPSMVGVAAVSMAISSTFYAFFAVAAYTTFGDDLKDDVLKNLQTEVMAPIIGGVQASVVAYTVRIAYVVSLLGSAALNLFPLRAAMFDVLYGDGPGKEAATHTYFKPLTIAVLLLVYVLAVDIPSIWVVIGFVGSIASTGVCYMFPALLIFSYQRSLGPATSRTVAHQAGSALIFSIGAFILVNGLTNPLQATPN